MKNLMRILRPLVEIFLKDQSSMRFAVGITFGLAFSICIILSTVGIMDGFDSTFKKALRQAVGDIYIYSSGRQGFFPMDKRLQESFSSLQISEFSPLVQSESFLIANEETKGVILRGVDPKSFGQVTSLHLSFGEGEVAVGTELAQILNLKVGDEVVLTFVSGDNDMNGLPTLKRFRIGSIVKHGIYQKDLRLVYMNRSELQALLGVGELFNVISLNVPKNAVAGQDSMEAVSDYQFRLRSLLGTQYSIRPFWSEFSALIEAVQIEKKAISLTLQTIVVIAIFNVLAFVIFLNERHSRSLFLFKAMGLSQKGLERIWFMMVTGVWIFSCALSLLFVQVVDWALQNLSFLQLPADIYYLGRLQLMITFKDYLIVFIATLFWLLLISWIGLRRMKKRPILQGLRKEFA